MDCLGVIEPTVPDVLGVLGVLRVPGVLGVPGTEGLCVLGVIEPTVPDVICSLRVLESTVGVESSNSDATDNLRGCCKLVNGSGSGSGKFLPDNGVGVLIVEPDGIGVVTVD